MSATTTIISTALWLAAGAGVAGLLFGLEPRHPEPITPANASDTTPRWAVAAWPAAAVLAIAYSVLYPMGWAA